jgi:hypothetical protein
MTTKAIAEIEDMQIPESLISTKPANSDKSFAPHLIHQRRRRETTLL